MKEWIAICLAVFLILSGLTVFGQRTSGVALSIQQLTEQIQAQIEKIKLAREQAEIQMSVARIRIAQQLERAEEDLLRQVEQLQRLQENLADQLVQTEVTAERLKNDVAVQLRNTALQVADQIKTTNDLITRLGAFKDSFDDKPSSTCDPLKDPNCPGTSGSNSNPLWSNPAGASSSPPQMPTPPPTPPASEEPTLLPPAPEPSMSPPSPAPPTGST
jgi:hypothetical protein